MKPGKYVLSPNLRLRGWKDHPNTLLRLDSMKPFEYTKEQYDLLLQLDGLHEIDPAALSGQQYLLLQEMLEEKTVHSAADGEVISDRQRYKQYPAAFKHEIQWSVTGKCNYKCRHCLISAPEKTFDEPSLDDCLDVVRQLKECGIHLVSLTGGEPLVSPYFWQILEALNREDIRLNSIYTNGALVTKEFLDRLLSMGLKPGITMSFDGIGWHDWMRGIPGAEEKVLKAFRLCHEGGLQTTAAMCLHRHNVGAVNDSIRLLNDLGCSFLKIGRTVPAGLWKKETEHFLSLDELFRQFYETIIPEYLEDRLPIGVSFSTLFRRDMPGNRCSIPAAVIPKDADDTDIPSCASLAIKAYISPERKVLPCMNMCGTAFETLCPSLDKGSLSDILSSPGYIDLCTVKCSQITSHNEKCRQCPYRNVCGGGCRAAAMGDQGTDFLTYSQEACDLFLNGWYEKALELITKAKKYS